MRVSRLFSVRRETKMPWHQSPSQKKKAVVFTTVTTNAYQGQLNAGFSKVCEIFKVRGIESLKYVREIYTPVCYYGEISTHWNVTLNEMNYVGQTASWAGLGQWNLPSIPDLQPSVWRSGYARLGIR